MCRSPGLSVLHNGVFTLQMEQFFEENCETGKAQRAHLMRRKTLSSCTAAQSRGARGQRGQGRLRRAPVQSAHAGHPPAMLPSQPLAALQLERVQPGSKHTSWQSSSRPLPGRRAARETGAAPGACPQHDCTDFGSPVPEYISCDNF